MACDHIGDVGHVGSDSEAGVVIDFLVRQFPLITGESSHGCWIHGADPIQIERRQGTGEPGGIPMDDISLQCSELLFRDSLANDKTSEIVLFHLVATGGASCAGLGEVSFGALEAFGSGEFEELVYG